MRLTPVWPALAALTANLPTTRYLKPLAVTSKILRSQKTVQIPYGFHATFVPKTVTKVVNRCYAGFTRKISIFIYI